MFPYFTGYLLYEMKAGWGKIEKSAPDLLSEKMSRAICSWKVMEGHRLEGTEIPHSTIL